MKGAARRLAAAVEAMRAGGGNAAQEQVQLKELVQALIAMHRYWKPELLANPTPPKKRSSKSNAALFQLLLAALIVFSGSHTNGSGAGLAGSGVSVSLSSSSTNTSECVHRLVCDMLVRCFDFSVVSSINETLMSKNAPLYIKVSLIMVVCRLPLQEALQFLPDVMTLTNKNIRAADYYMKQCLLESAAHALDGESMRLISFHPEALKIVNKSFQDKVPEVRIAASRLLLVLAERTSTSVASSAGSGAGGSMGAGSGNASGNGGASNTTGTTAGASGGGSSANTYSVSLDSILQIAAKGMDDIAPEARRAFSVVVGVVFAKYATSSSGETEIHSVGSDSNSTSTPSLGTNDEDASGKASVESDTPSNSGIGTGKAKTGFKLHVPGMTSINLPSSLSRRKTATVNFLTIADVILHLKEMVTSKYISSNRNQSYGGILASFSIALTSMFERLPPDSIAENQLRDVMNATLAILDYPFDHGDLTRARNAVGFVLRNGLSGCLTERQQELLLGVYLQRLKGENQISEPNHHKILSVLVEVSHLFQSLGEASVTRALDASDILQDLICHEKQSVRFQAAIALASLITAIPYQLEHVLIKCIHGLRDTAEYLMRGGSDVEGSKKSTIAEKTGGGQDGGNESKTLLYAIQGKSAAIVHILRAIEIGSKEGISQTIMNDIFIISEELVESQFLNECADSIWLTCTRAGWTLVSSLVSINCDQWFKANLGKLLNLWLKSSVLHSRESSLELLRIEAAAITLSSFLSKYQDLAIDRENDVNLLANHVLHVYLTATQDTLSKPLKRRGQLARYRLMGWIVHCFSMLPPIYSDSYIVLLDLIAESTTAQALTNLRHSSQVPAKSTYLRSVLSSDDNTLDIVTLSRLEVGDYPSPLYSKELNHVLSFLQQENPLTDTELEVQYLDIFRRSVAEKYVLDESTTKVCYSPFTDVRLVDASIVLFGRLFHFIPEDLQLRCLQHYAGALTDLRVDCEVNVCSLLFAVIAEARRLESSGAAPTLFTSLSATSWPLQIQTMLCDLISSENAEVRRGAGEALGTLALLLGEDHCKGLIIELEKRLVGDKLAQGASNTTAGSSSDLDVSIVSAGAAFALACIKRACGFRISIDTGLILRFTCVCSQPLRTWILHSWGIILESANSTGGDYEQYVSSTFSLMEAHVLAGFAYSKVNQCNLRWQISAKVALGRIINDVVAALGPELDGSSDRLDQLYSLWLFLRQDGDARVELEFLRFLEQVVVFAPSRFQCADLMYILRIISDTALLNAATPLTSGHLLSPSPSDHSSALTLKALGEPFVQNGLVNVGVFTNGWSRSILQNVGLSCIRTLVERDPTLIRRHNLFCLIFSALHVEYNELLWNYLPGLHGMWDVLSFVDSALSQRNSINSLRNTALALLDIECRDHEGAEPCLWALLCRSIAIGESASTIAGVSKEQLMMSPKGTLAMPANFEQSGDEDTFSSSSTRVMDIRETDPSSLTSAAVAAQVNTWRMTKASVGEFVALMPPLSRQVRHFAVECVLRVMQVMARSPPQAIEMRQLKQLHFDLIAARRYYFEVLSARAARSASTTICAGNFLCMYVDEFVTLACQVTTTSAEGNELLMFQCVGLQLLNVLVKSFASARDPEVASGDAYLLDPYRAQISSAVRHALNQVQVKPTLMTATTESDRSERTYFYAPLFLEAHCIAGACISAHIIQDKVGLGRILRAVMTYDYGHAHFIGDEITRNSLSLANLASISELLTASITEAIAKKDARDDEATAIAISPLVKAMTNGLSGTTEYLFKCWIDVTFCYSVVMQGSAQWAQFDAGTSAALRADESIVLPALQMPLPPVGQAATTVLAAAFSTSKTLRELYKRYWPRIVNAMAVLQVYMPKSVSLCCSTGGNIPQWSLALLSSAVFHVNANARDRMEDESELPAVLRSFPLLLRAIANSRLKQSGTSSVNFSVLLMTAVETLILASKRCSGPAQVVAIKAMFSCLSLENLDLAREICRSLADGDKLRATLFNTVAQAWLCPTEVVCQLCDVTEHTRHARAVSIGSRTTESRRDFVGNDEDAQYMTEIVQFATTGIVFLHTTEEARTAVVRSVAMVQQIVCSVASYNSSAVKEAVVTLSRASTEAVLALARTLESNAESDADTLNSIHCSLRGCFEFLSEWLKVDIHSTPGFSLQIVANYAVSFPTSINDYAERFHAEIAKMASTLLEDAARGEQKQQQAATTAEVLRGLHSIVTKLIDVNQTAMLNRYLVALGPYLVEMVGATKGHPSTTAELDEMNQAEKLLRVLTTQLSEQHGSTFVHMLLPRLAAVLSYEHPSGTDSLIPEKVSSILGRLLLCFAQTHASAFKETVAAMTPSLRGVLETTLRLALKGSISDTGVRTQSSVLQGPVAATKLDLSQYA